MNNESQYFATRHARPERNKTPNDPASKEYPDITERGVEQAKEKARREISDLIKNAPEDAVVVLAATSDQPRTKQTAEIYGDELAIIQQLNQDANIIVITKRDIENLIPDNAKQKPAEKSFLPGQIISIVKKLETIIQQNPAKKIIIDYPLMVKELAYKYHDRWTDKSGKKTKYFAEILKKHNNSHDEAGKDWIANNGRLELSDGKIIQGPNPENVAREYLQGVQRLYEFAQKYTHGRPLLVGEVGHQWDLDALIVALANNGKVDKESFERITGGDIAGETEMAEFMVSDSKTKVKYRGQELNIEHGSQS